MDNNILLLIKNDKLDDEEDDGMNMEVIMMVHENYVIHFPYDEVQ
jgi:hypothetical protein